VNFLLVEWSWLKRYLRYWGTMSRGIDLDVRMIKSSMNLKGYFWSSAGSLGLTCLYSLKSDYEGPILDFDNDCSLNIEAYCFLAGFLPGLICILEVYGDLCVGLRMGYFLENDWSLWD
jgi:hypothetical protein